jgi:hypothetical protein
MRQADLLVFNDIIYTGTTAYTIATLNDALAQHDMIAVMAVIDNVSASTPGFDLFIEQSCDGRNWVQRNDTGQAFPPSEIAGAGDITIASMGINTTYARMYADAAWNLTKVGVSGGGAGGPLLCYVRFAMKLSAGFAHVKLYAILRDTTASTGSAGGQATRHARGARK